MVSERLADDDVIAEVLEPDGGHLIGGANKRCDDHQSPEYLFYVTLEQLKHETDKGSKDAVLVPKFVY